MEIIPKMGGKEEGTMALGCGFVRMRGERSEGIEGKNFEI